MIIDYVEHHFTRVASAEEFDAMAACVIDYQIAHCPVYRKFAEAYRYLPVAALKYAPIATFPVKDAERVFLSSGTGDGQSRSRHLVRRLSVYERSVVSHYRQVVGPDAHTILAHLPHYASESSLVCMAEILIERCGDEYSGFFLRDLSGIERAVERGRPLVLLGAAFGLLDLLEKHRWNLPEGSRIIETGGMKTHRRQIGRSQLHARLGDGFGLPEEQILSEYGMCELLSQAYACGGVVYYPPPWMRFSVRDPETSERLEEGVPGALAVVDLANLYSVSCLLTEDLAIQRGEGFEVVGRLPQSALRGCNFLLEGAMS